MSLGGPHVAFTGGGGGAAPGAAPPLRPFVTGLWYGPGPKGSSAAVSTLKTVLVFAPWVIPSGGLPLGTMVFTVSARTAWPTTTANTLSVAWFDDAGGFPGARTVTLGTYHLKHALTTVGTFWLKTLTGTVPAGMAWFCVLLIAPSSAIVFSAITTTPVAWKQGSAIYGQRPRRTLLGAGTSTTSFGWSSTAAYASIPASAPPLATLTPQHQTFLPFVAVKPR